MKQPHTYSMPNSFVKDQSVPARWRLLGYLNGFFLNGLTCWASNETIGKEIASHKDTVSQAVSELEEMGLITSKRTRRTRVISQVLKDEIGVGTYLRSAVPPISDRREHLTNSVSNSEKKVQDSPSENNISFEEQEIRIVPDGEEKEPRAKADPKVRQIAEAYMNHKKFVYKTAGHKLRDLARNMKTAKKLVEFTGPEIYKCIEFCEEKFGDMWTLETVEKQMSNAHKS